MMNDAVGSKAGGDKLRSDRAKQWIINMSSSSRGKGYIMDMYLESCFITKEYHAKLLPYNSTGEA